MTVATLAHLAWAVVLARCSGQDDVVFGTVLLGRLQSGADLSRVVGPCINTLPLRLRLVDVGLAEAARQIQHQLNTLIRFEHTPLELAQRCSGLAAPLVQVLINYRSTADATLASDATSGQLSGVRELTRLDERTHLPVVISLDAHRDELHLSLQSQEPSVAQRLLAHMITTLERLGDALLQTPELPLSRLSSLPDDERHLLLTTCNDTRLPYPANTSIEDLFAAQVQRDSAAIAVETIDEALSYGELNASADALAERLQAQGVGPETIVAVILERSSAMVVAVLGVLKAGGAYLPLDPATPPARRDALLLQARCSHCLDRPEQVWRASAQVRLIHDSAAPRSPHPHARSSSQPSDAGRRLAYINFTSGSTGIPKAVAIEHRSVNRLVINNPPLRFGPGERVLQLAPLAFDAATLEVWGALLNGGTLVVHPPGQPSPAQLALFLQQRRITTLWLTAGLFHLMVEEACEVLQQVPQLVAGGDRLNPDLVRRVLSGLPKGHRLINGYGPTENTTFTCCFAMEHSTSIGGSVPIGRPISNTSVFVLDAQQQPVPVGVVGELYIGGDGLAREYLHDPERTAEQFVWLDGLCSDATAAEGPVPQRLYRSGDLVSWSADGVLLFHGRNDHQIKLRGFRIEPQEIEAQLQQQSGVAQSLVLALPAPAGGKRLIAYVTPQSGSSADLNAEALRQVLTTQLPDVMVPAAVVVLDHFPITANGKVDRQALPAPAQTGSAATDRRFRLDPLAAIVLEIWEAVLGLKDIGADDNFFDCGGHSLAAARVVARLEKRLPTSLSPSDLFRYPTPRALTERLRHNHDRDPENPLVPLRPSGDGIPLFLIHGMFGDVFGFVDVVRQLPSPMPVWGVQMPRSLANGPRLDLESLACHYAACIQRQQPQGPYRLMAGSAGGWIAYAVAGALLEQGVQIDRLILLDTLANPPLRRRTRLRMLQAYGHQRLTRPRDDQRSTIDDLRFILGPRWRRQGLVERFGLGLHARRWLRDDDTDPTLAMVRRFRPPRLPLDIDLLTPHPPDHWSLRFWPDLIDGQLRQHQLFNAHADFFAAEHASTLAQRVDSLLRDATGVSV